MSATDQRRKLLAHFLSDFTLGFSDGLTVPFALTAGLGSLGRTETVIFAGLAELCAGSISMGIGGYLSALEEARDQQQPNTAHGDDLEESRGMLSPRQISAWTTGSRRGSEDSYTSTYSDEKKMGYNDDDVQTLTRHLAPLDLPADVVVQVINTIRQRQGTAQAARALHQQKDENLDGNGPRLTPVMSGLSISIGYLIGGLIPLFPYLFSSTIDSAMWWSTALCLAALFLYGSGKCWMLSKSHGSKRMSHAIKVRQTLWEGFRMLFFGGVAAAAAVLCVHLADGGGNDELVV